MQHTETLAANTGLEEDFIKLFFFFLSHQNLWEDKKKNPANLLPAPRDWGTALCSVPSQVISIRAEGMRTTAHSELAAFYIHLAEM